MTREQLIDKCVRHVAEDRFDVGSKTGWLSVLRDLQATRVVWPGYFRRLVGAEFNNNVHLLSE